MRKAQLVSIWKKLHKGCEALEQLIESGIADKDGYVFSELVSIKNQVEELIEQKTRKKIET